MMDAFAEARSDVILPEAVPGTSSAPRARAFETLPYLPDVAPDRVVARAARFAPLFDLEGMVAAKRQELEALDAECARRMEEGYQSGYNDGLAQARAEAAVWHANSEIRAQHFFSDAEPVVVSLAFEVARKVIGAFEPFDVLRRIAERAVREHADTERPVIAVAPDREGILAAVAADLAAHARDLPDLVVKVDPRLAAGRAMLVTRFGSVDLDTDSQIDAVRSALIGLAGDAGR